VELDTADMTRTGIDQPYAHPQSALTAGSLAPSACGDAGVFVSALARPAVHLTNSNTEA